MLIKPMRNPIQLICGEFPMAGGVSIFVDENIARNQGRSSGYGARGRGEALAADPFVTSAPGVSGPVPSSSTVK
jgi:hypothetical protein